MFKRILVPLDTSPAAEKALPIAIRIARQAGGKVVLLRVVSAQTAVLPLRRQPEQERKRKARSYLRLLKQTHGCEQCEELVISHSGNPAKIILDTIESHNIDLLVMSKHGQSGLGNWLLGSVTEKVLRFSSCPVLAVRESTIPQHTLFALDGSDKAEEALTPGLALARCLQSNVTLLHVAQEEDLPPEQLMQIQQNDSLTQTQFEKILSKYGTDYLMKVQNEHKQANEEWQLAVVMGESAPKILDYSQNQGIDLIVINSHGRTDSARWQYGRVSERVLRRAKSAVLLVRQA